MLNRYTQYTEMLREQDFVRQAYERHEHEEVELSNEYIRGLVEGEGCFTFHTHTVTKINNSDGQKTRGPAFVLQMHIRDRCLIEGVKKKLGLKNQIYFYPPYTKDGSKRDWSVRLIVREYNNLKDIIIPFFYKKLKGNKGRQFTEWMGKIGSDPYISDKFKNLYRLYKSGFYESKDNININLLG